MCPRYMGPASASSSLRRFPFLISRRFPFLSRYQACKVNILNTSQNNARPHLARMLKWVGVKEEIIDLLY